MSKPKKAILFLWQWWGSGWDFSDCFVWGNTVRLSKGEARINDQFVANRSRVDCLAVLTLFAYLDGRRQTRRHPCRSSSIFSKFTGGIYVGSHPFSGSSLFQAFLLEIIGFLLIRVYSPISLWLYSCVGQKDYPARHALWCFSDKFGVFSVFSVTIILP